MPSTFGKLRLTQLVMPGGRQSCGAMTLQDDGLAGACAAQPAVIRRELLIDRTMLD